MKTLFTFLVLIFFLTTAQAQDIDATLGGNTSNEEFSIKNLAGNTLFRVNGLGNVGIGMNYSPAAKLSFGGLVGSPAILLYQGNAADRYGFGIQAGELQTFIPTTSHISFNSGGDLQPSGTNEVMRITGNGNVGIGTTSPAYTLDVINNSADTFAVNIQNQSPSGLGLVLSAASGGFEEVLNIESSQGKLFGVRANGNVGGLFGTYHEPSDKRLKKEIISIPDALDKVMNLRGVNYKWKDSERDQSLQMGLIAQEVEKVVPEVVHTADDEMQTKAVEYQYLVGLLIEAVKEQQKQIEDLESRINSIALKELDTESYGYIKTNMNNSENFYSVMR